MDKSITAYFYTYNPTLSNVPASGWTTADLKDLHVGDTFLTQVQTGAGDSRKPGTRMPG